MTRILYLIAFSPVFVTLFIVNGLFSVRGFPFIAALIMGVPVAELPEALYIILTSLGWLFVVGTTCFEFTLFIQRTLRAISGERWVLSGFVMVYDYITTAAGLFLLFTSFGTLPWVVWAGLAMLSALVLTPAAELIAALIWRLK